MTEESKGCQQRPKFNIVSGGSPSNTAESFIDNLDEVYDINSTGTSGGGGGDMSDRLLILEQKVKRLDERMGNLGRTFRAFRGETRAEFAHTRRHITVAAVACLAIGITVIIGFAQVQNSSLQKVMDANHETIQKQTDEFRRDSDRNYELALKALERSMGQQKPNE